ncbi:MAG: acyltransferase family protein [Lachnospiraceae bacterium]|nr:acyltransferase family protein [Lachnospiraceae bacterium]
MSNTKTSGRLPGLDLVRSTAALFVVSVHFFFNCGYYSTPLNNRVTFVMTAARWLFLCCVPLYMMLTGYFKCNKDIDKAHYMSLIPVFAAYFVISTIKIFVGNYYYGKVYGIKEALAAMGNYTIGWYVGFYLSLMAIAPFLNRLWHALKSKKEQHILLISLAMVTTLYPIIALPAASSNTLIASVSSVVELAAPNYWQMMYPLLYYFLGCYLRENRPKLNKLLLIAVIVILPIINAVISYKYAAGGNFNWSILGTVDCGYNCITVAVCAAAIFLLLYDIDIKNGFIKKILALISSVSLEIYLFSGTLDIIIFDYAKRRYFEMKDFAWLFFILVPLNFILSVILSLLYKAIYNFIAGILTRKTHE